jgi:hypothetical protein
VSYEPASECGKDKEGQIFNGLCSDKILFFFIFEDPTVYICRVKKKRDLKKTLLKNLQIMAKVRPIFIRKLYRDYVPTYLPTYHRKNKNYLPSLLHPQLNAGSSTYI